MTLSYAYFVPKDAYVLSLGGHWRLDSMIKERAMLNVLVDGGDTPAGAQAVLRSGRYIKVYGAGLAPRQPSVYRDLDTGCLFLNTYVQPSLTSVQGEWPVLARVLSWLCGGDVAGVRWLMHWLAAKVQDPSYLAKVAVVFATEQGAGKGILTYVMRQILGEANTAIIERPNLESPFNSRWADKLFILGDEVINGDRSKNIDERLKVLIDGGTIEIEEKYVPKRTVRNQSAWMFASNSKVGPLNLEFGDRRFTFFDNHAALPADYVAALNGLYEDDRVTPTAAFRTEIAAFAWDLERLAVDVAAVRRPYANADRDALIVASRPSQEDFFHYVDEQGVDELLEAVVMRGDYTLTGNRERWEFPDGSIATQVLYLCYTEYCRRTGSKPLKLQRFGIAAKNHSPPWERGRRYVKALDRQVYVYQVPRNKRPKETAEVRA